MAKGAKRAKALADKRAAKAQRMARDGRESTSRYALKMRGQVQREYDHGQVAACSVCYMRFCRCRSYTGVASTSEDNRDHS